jgi:hypothetical protein
MGRPPLRKKGPMTDAERQRRRRQRLKKEEAAAMSERHRKVESLKRRAKAAQRFVPAPPGIVYYRRFELTLQDGSEMEVVQPDIRPLAYCAHELDDEDVLALLDELHGIAASRGLDLSHVPAYPEDGQVYRDLGPSETVYISVNRPIRASERGRRVVKGMDTLKALRDAVDGDKLAFQAKD